MAPLSSLGPVGRERASVMCGSFSVLHGCMSVELMSAVVDGAMILFSMLSSRLDPSASLAVDWLENSSQYGSQGKHESLPLLR